MLDNPQEWVRDETPIYLFNPLDEDISVTKFIEDNTKVNYLIPALEMVTYPKYIADILKKHMVDAIINKRELGYLNNEQRREIEKEVEVKIDG